MARPLSSPSSSSKTDFEQAARDAYNAVMRRVLLLNGSREPLNFISEERALLLVMKERVEVLDVWSDEPFMSAQGMHVVPALIALRRYINKRWRAPRFRRRALFNRDGWLCQYCRLALTNSTAEVDHVIPRSRGGRNTWTNCVTSCRKCNKMKRDRTPDEAEMRLSCTPRDPHPLHFMEASSRALWHPSWDPYIPRS
jgi:hypothetical protein